MQPLAVTKNSRLINTEEGILTNQVSMFNEYFSTIVTQRVSWIPIRQLTGSDRILVNVVKMVASAIVGCLTSLNTILDSGQVPSEWKSANITSVLIGGDREQLKNY